VFRVMIDAQFARDFVLMPLTNPLAQTGGAWRAAGPYPTLFGRTTGGSGGRANETRQSLNDKNIGASIFFKHSSPCRQRYVLVALDVWRKGREIKERDTLSCLFSTKIFKYFIQLEIWNLKNNLVWKNLE